MSGGAVLAAMLLLASAAADDMVAKEAQLDEAMECRAYSQFAVVAVPSPVGDKFARYWVAESERRGAKLGLSKDTVYIRHLVVKIDADKAKPIWKKCLDLTPKKVFK